VPGHQQDAPESGHRGGTSLANYIKNPRFGVEEIRGLYNNTAFPLNRRVKLIESAALRSACGVAR